MAPSKSEGQKAEISTARIFWTGALLMFFWPLWGAASGPLQDPVQILIYFVGGFFFLFEDVLVQLDNALENVPLWYDVAWFGLIIVIVAMWLAILFLPLLGSWNRRPVILWICQTTYAASQAILGSMLIAKWG